jgi:hypothetical protein
MRPWYATTLLRLKNQSLQWVKKGQQGTFKGKDLCQLDQADAVGIFDSKGLVYSHIIPKGSAVNGKYIVNALGNFLKQMKNQRPVMVEQEWWFH